MAAVWVVAEAAEPLIKVPPTQRGKLMPVSKPAPTDKPCSVAVPAVIAARFIPYRVSASPLELVKDMFIPALVSVASPSSAWVKAMARASAPSVVTPETDKLSWSVDAVEFVKERFSPAAKVKSASTLKVTTDPSSVMVELSILPVVLLNLAMALVMEGSVNVTPEPPPLPLQFPESKQTSPEALGKVIVLSVNVGSVI